MAVRMVRARSAEEIPVVTPSRASIDCVNAVPNVEVLFSGLHRKPKIIATGRRQGQTDKAATLHGHESDDFRGDELRRDGEVALILAVFVIHHDDHASGVDFRNRVGNGDEGHGVSLSLQRR